MSCRNKRFCLVAINAGRRRGMPSVGSPWLLALEEAPPRSRGGRQGWLPAAPEVALLLCRIQLHPTALGLNELDCISTPTGSLSLAWFWKSSHRQVRWACCFLKERWRPLPPVSSRVHFTDEKATWNRMFFRLKTKQRKVYLTLSLHKGHWNTQRLISKFGNVLFKANIKWGLEAHWAM